MRIEKGDISVGFTLLAGSILVIASWLWITNPNDDYFPLFTEYAGVEGLTEQTAVRLQGFAVGRIQEIVPQTTDRGSVTFRVELRIEREFVGDSALQIPRGTVAHVRYPPVVGPPFIVLEPPQEGGEALTPGEEITGMMTRSFLDEMQTLTSQLSASVTETLLRAQALIDSVGETMGRFDRTFSSTSGALPEVLANLNSTVLAAATLVEAVDAELASTMPRVRESVDTATLLLEDTRRILSRVEELLDSSQPRAEAILANLDSATFVLDHFIREVAQKPTRLITGVPAPPPMPRRGGTPFPPEEKGGEDKPSPRSPRAAPVSPPRSNPAGAGSTKWQSNQLSTRIAVGEWPGVHRGMDVRFPAGGFSFGKGVEDQVWSDPLRTTKS